ncbi:hypothetical protein BSKO_12941 [Bryopsis sp. KO-2023]|nr:hypothetical protein BSKO_12941 [Bryopsis sp. KO-2023]
MARRMPFGARPNLAEPLRTKSTDLGKWTSKTQIPLVYSERYNFQFWGIEKLHPFDSCKFRSIIGRLSDAGLVAKSECVEPVEVPKDVLLDVHEASYLRKLERNKLYVVQVVELFPLLFVPNFLVQNKLMVPMRFHVAGTMLAALMAVEKGWAINLGGGMHHACHNEGMGWCFYSDIYLAVRRVREATAGEIQKVLVIDLDVHQGNGIARDKMHFQDDDLFILDMYNSEIFPRDLPAMPSIGTKVSFGCGESGETYLPNLRKALQSAREAFEPDMVFFNAGTDVLEGDPLGRVCLSSRDVVERDEIVFGFAKELDVPICMVLSGGYLRTSAEVISNSITNLIKTYGLIGGGENVG